MHEDQWVIHRITGWWEGLAGPGPEGERRPKRWPGDQLPGGGRACHSTSSHFTEPLTGLVSWLVSLKGQSFQQPKRYN